MFLIVIVTVVIAVLRGGGSGGVGSVTEGGSTCMDDGEGCTGAGTSAEDGESCCVSSANPLWAIEIKPAISRIFNLGKREGIRASAKWI
jgi:hypothetical protein